MKRKSKHRPRVSGRRLKKDIEGVLGYISEAGMLKRVARSGWSVAGIKCAESVADHSFRCAVIGYALSRMEHADPYKVLLMTLFGDMQESRITDLHKMAQRYIDPEEAEILSFSDQVRALPVKIRKELTATRAEYNSQDTDESVIARDADILECLIQAKEYFEQGHKDASHLMKKAPRFLRSLSARRLWREAKRARLSDWWSLLGVFKR
ncbi:HD family hydrolase [Candidatus Omnitrophota bacterium]